MTTGSPDEPVGPEDALDPASRGDYSTRIDSGPHMVTQVIPEEERRAMLVEHGMMGRDYTMIKSNTVAAFALGDYEWVLALESPELHEIVDMMRHLRSSQARRHVREEIPFYTGRHVDAATAIDILR